MYKDKTIVCRDCGKEFVFTVGEQKFFLTRYDDRGLPLQAPKRCAACRLLKKNRAVSPFKKIADDVRKHPEILEPKEPEDFSGATPGDR